MSELEQQLYLGIDGGGTKCKAILVNQNLEVLGTGISGPANPYRDLKGTVSSITESAILAVQDADLSTTVIADLVVGMGLAGVSNPVGRDNIVRWEHPFKVAHITTDLHTAVYGAHHSTDGAIIITGTGSSGIVCKDDFSQIHGGHGFPHGDKGSGSWVGMKAVEMVLLALDDLAEETQLTASLLSFIEGKDAGDIVTYLHQAKPGVYAQLAPLVFEAAQNQDAISIAIVKDAAAYVSSLARRLNQYDPKRFSMIGGLSEKLNKWLDADVRTLLSEPKDGPEIGAAWLAVNLHKKEQGHG